MEISITVLLATCSLAAGLLMPAFQHHAESRGTSFCSSTSTSTAADVSALANDACGFLTASKDPFHSVFETTNKLQANGFKKISPSNDFSKLNSKPCGKYYYKIHQSTLVAFAVGGKV